MPFVLLLILKLIVPSVELVIWFVWPVPVKLPETLKVPLTSNAELGLVFLIPTLPVSPLHAKIEPNPVLSLHTCQ